MDNINGQAIGSQQQIYLNEGMNNPSFSSEDLSQGVYQLVLVVNGERHVMRLVKI